jgi:hypothetical protein
MGTVEVLDKIVELVQMGGQAAIIVAIMHYVTYLVHYVFSAYIVYRAIKFVASRLFDMILNMKDKDLAIEKEKTFRYRNWKNYVAWTEVEKKIDK